MDTTPIETATMTVDQAAAVLGISRGLAYAAVRSGELPAVRLRGRILIPRAALNRLLDAAAPSE